MQHTPIFEMLSRQDGVALPSMEEEREARLPRVEDAMRPASIVLGGDEVVAAAIARLGEHAAAPVALTGAAWAAISRGDLDMLHSAGRGNDTLAGSLARDARVRPVHPDQPLDTALRLLRDHPLLPVVHRADARKLEGILTVEDILLAYRSAAIKE
jgi:CIC family chloride channel protein